LIRFTGFYLLVNMVLIEFPEIPMLNRQPLIIASFMDIITGPKILYF